jgi:dTDP-4-dehydrorhamnose reductase
MKIAILGSTGLLGNTVAKHFLSNTKYEVVCTHRNEKVKVKDDSVYFDALEPDFSFLDKCDYVINCIGIIKPFMKEDLINNIYINAIFPRKLSDYCETKKVKLIHITTDCVFSGKDGNYSEFSLHDCLDEYGKSKSLGEPNNCMVIRTSIIGEEIHKNASLISWAKSMKGKEVNGFLNHLWNGITTKRYAEICEEIIKNNLFETNLFHIYSNYLSKYELLHLINKKFDLQLKINEYFDKIPIDRRLTTNKDLKNKISFKSIQQQMQEL